MPPYPVIYFCTVYGYAGKADLSMVYWNPERKLGVAGHFLEVIKQQIIILNNSKIQSNVWGFFQIEALLSLKNERGGDACRKF